jgi:hypothetical protein
VAEVEYGLLEYLWRHWESERSADSDLFARFYCNEIVKAIGKHGSAKSLEMMEVIQYKLAASVQELRASLPDDWDEDIRVFSAPELIGMGIFLKNVREAVSSLRRRCGEPACPSPQDSKGLSGTTIRPSQTPAERASPPGPGEQDLAPASPLPFGEYDLVEQVAKGGMAEAFIARQRSTGRRVFLKRVALLSTADAASIQREAALYAKLTRAGISGVLQAVDAGRFDDYYFLVTEFADGGDLEEYVMRNPDRQLSQSEAKAIGVEIAATLCGLHAIVVVHRDLKPGNIMCVNGAWKIGDFGIGKNLARLVTQRTLQGAGTSGYAPPEQLDGVEAHPSADVYAFGKILVFLLSGQTDVDRIHLPRWRDLILRCTDRDRDNRPDAAAVLAGIQSILV